MGSQNEPIWDGNGGTLDPAKATQRDMMIALHVKMDSIVIPQLTALGEWRRNQEMGEFTSGQQRSILDVIQSHRDKGLDRRAMKVPFFLLALSAASLIATIVLTLVATGNGAL